MNANITGIGSCVMLKYLYSFFDTTSSATNCKMSTGLNFPDRSTITNMSCRIYNNFYVTSPSVSLNRVSTSNLTDDEMARASVGGSASVQYADDTSIVNGTIDNDNYSYYLEFSPGNTTDVHDKHRFYSCEFTYTY